MTDTSWANDRIFGYDSKYYSAHAPRLIAFTYLQGKQRPESFNVAPVPGDPRIQDHQSHIVPQNRFDGFLRTVAEVLWQEVSAQAHPEDADIDALVQNTPGLEKDKGWLLKVLAYSRTLQAPGAARPYEFFSFNNGSKAIEKFGDFFSIVLWNPVNLARAPDDKERATPPRENVDTEVIHRLSGLAAQAPYSLWYAALSELAEGIASERPPAEITTLLRAYIVACSDTLGNPEVFGFYQFNWTIAPDGNRLSIDSAIPL
jgi:hypothetical protein